MTPPPFIIATMPKTRSRLSRKQFVILISIITAIALPIILVLVFGIFSPVNSSSSMTNFNFENVDVKLMTKEQMDSLVGLEFNDSAVVPTSDRFFIRSQLPRNNRVIPKGSMVTMDFQEDRLNVYLDGENKVFKVKKG